jgi:hypothetical protein
MSYTRYKGWRARPPRRNGWQIVDPDQLAALLQERCEAVGGPTELAEQLGLSRMDLWRLRSGRRKTITKSTYRRLLRGVPTHRLEDWSAAFLSPAARQRLDRHDDWIAKAQRTLYGVAHGPATGVQVVTGRVVPGPRLPSAMRSAVQDGYIAFVTLRVAGDDARPPLPVDVRSAIEDLLGYKRYFESFRQRVRRRRGSGVESAGRIEVAELEAIAPLVVAGYTAGIERTAWELHEARQLGPYLQVALKAQELLLRRAPAIRRAQEAELVVPSRANPLGAPREVLPPRESRSTKSRSR